MTITMRPLLMGMWRSNSNAHILKSAFKESLIFLSIVFRWNLFSLKILRNCLIIHYHMGVIMSWDNQVISLSSNLLVLIKWHWRYRGLGALILLQINKYDVHLGGSVIGDLEIHRVEGSMSITRVPKQLCHIFARAVMWLSRPMIIPFS